MKGSLFDPDRLLQQGFSDFEIDGGAGVDAAQRLALVDVLAAFHEVVEADGVVDAIRRPRAAGAELEGGLADEAGVDLHDRPAAVGGEIADQRGMVDLPELRQVGGISAVGRDDLLEPPARAAIV
jgi:hypothetical protein